MRCEIILDGSEIEKGQRILKAMAKAGPSCGIEIDFTRAYRGGSDWLMIYGLGHQVRGKYFKKHVAQGGHAICWDLGYFGREQSKSFPMRLSIDQAHPQAWMKTMLSDRWDAANISLRSDYNPSGPIVLAGTGNKERNRLGLSGCEWEENKFKEIRAVYPSTPIIYRPKGNSKEPLGDCIVASEGKIEDVIRGASLVVVKHSNVAVDACIAGIPVVCEDGAAASLYGNDLYKPLNPSEAERYQFLCNLAYWQWRSEEASACWHFIKRNLCV